MTRIAITDAIEAKGEKLEATIRVTGGRESEIVIVVPLGVAYDTADLLDREAAILALSEASAEDMLVPLVYALASVMADNVALKADMDSARVAIEELQGFFGPSGHTHAGVTVGMGVTGPPSAQADETVQSQGSDVFKVTHG